MMYVICFYWQGDRWQQEGYVEKPDHINHQQSFMDHAGIVADDLPAQYINNLYAGVKRFATKEFKFVCFTDQQIPGLVDEVEVRAFERVTEHGVLPRLYMFSEESELWGHQVLCIDLDVVVVGSLKHIMDYEGVFCTRSKFKRGKEYKLDGDIMSFQAGLENTKRFWEPFIADTTAAEELTQGRERHWVRAVASDIADRWEIIAPNSIVSYKWNIRRGEKISCNTSFVSCHGTPRPHEIQEAWIQEYWKPIKNVEV